MKQDYIAKASVTIDTPVAAVWEALISPASIRKYMFGTEVVTEWKIGGPILWKGVWEGKPYEDKGVLLEMEPRKILRYSHFSPLSGLPDVPENHHILTYELTDQAGHTSLSLSQDNNATEKARDHSEKMWKTMVESIKSLLEKRP